MTVERLRDWLDRAPFTRDLELELRTADGAVCRLVLPLAVRHTGLAGAVHGGAIASLASVSAQVAARAAQPEAPARRVVSLHVAYARAARGGPLTVETRVVRRAQELGFFVAEVSDEGGNAVAGASVTLGEDPDGAGPAPVGQGAVGPGAVGPAAAGDPGVFNAAIETIPFLAGREVRTTGVDRGRIDVTMAPAERNLDCDGTIHEGAVLTLIDLAGSSCPWTVVPPSPGSSGATVALHAHVVEPATRGGLVATATARASSARIHWCDVTVLGADDRRLRALGTVVYRQLAGNTRRETNQ